MTVARPTRRRPTEGALSVEAQLEQARSRDRRAAPQGRDVPRSRPARPGRLRQLQAPHRPGARAEDPRRQRRAADQLLPVLDDLQRALANLPAGPRRARLAAGRRHDRSEARATCSRSRAWSRSAARATSSIRTSTRPSPTKSIPSTTKGRSPASTASATASEIASCARPRWSSRGGRPGRRHRPGVSPGRSAKARRTDAERAAAPQLTVTHVSPRA